MEYIDIINQVVEAERRAKKIENDARSRLENINQEAAEAADNMNREFMDRARRRVDIVRNSEEAVTEELLASLDEKLTLDLAAVERSFEKDREVWVRKLFHMIVG